MLHITKKILIVKSRQIGIAILWLKSQLCYLRNQLLDSVIPKGAAD